MVVYDTTETRRDVLSVEAPHRAAAKRRVAERYAEAEESITAFEDCYVPRPTWDCPICGTHESMAKRPNLRSPPEWECRVCGTYGWGEPRDWAYLSEPRSTIGSPMTGHKTPDGSILNAPTEVHR
jgi:rubrerythrin